MTSKSMLLAGLLLLGAFASLAPPSRAASACTDIPYDDSCPSTLCVVPTPETGFCTTEQVCVVGETRCIGNLVCIGSLCVPDPCYRTVCATSGPQGPAGCTEVIGAAAASVWCQPGGTTLGSVCFLEIVGPDLLIRSCLDPDNPDCLVYAERWGKEGEYMGKTCILP